MVPGVAVSAAVVGVLVTAVANILFQMSAPPGNLSTWEDLTLKGALISAVVVLWRALSAERAQNVKSNEAMTSALVSTAASNAELRKIIEHLNESLLKARSV